MCHAWMGETNEPGILRKSFQEGVRLEDLSVGMTMILKLILKKENGKICLGRIGIIVWTKER